MKIDKVLIAIGLAVVALMAATSARASITAVGSPYSTHSWAQGWADPESFSYNAVQLNWVAGSTFESPGFTSLSLDWTSYYNTTTVTTSAGPDTTDLNFSSNFNGTSQDAVFIWTDYENGNVQAAYEMFYGDTLTGQSDAGSGWTYNILDNAQAPSLTPVPETPVPEPTTMVAGVMLLLPFGASTLRILRKSRTA
jgi:hypothetical protein